MTSPVDIVNISLAEIGSQSSVQRINPSDGSTESNIASTLYTPKIDALHRAAHWNCAKFQGALTLLRAAVIDGEVSDDPPPLPWYYEYLYPPECLQARYILPFVDTATSLDAPLTTGIAVLPNQFLGPPARFSVSMDIVNGKQTRVILTNAKDAILVYTRRIVNPDLWDPHFLGAATSLLGAWFVNALFRNRALMMDQFNTAKELIQQARISDGNEGLTSADHMPDWMTVRGTNANGLDGLYYQGWQPLGFPYGMWV